MSKPYPTIEEVEHRLGFAEAWWPTHCTNEDIIRHICDIDRERGEAPAESIPWAEYPWAKWAAADSDTQVGMHEKEPLETEVSNGIWHSSGRIAHLPHGSITIPGPWQESLRARPEGV